MILQNKNAVIYGAGGSLGGAVAKAFAAAGARVFLTGRNVQSVQVVAQEIIASGGQVEITQVDGFNEQEIKKHLQKVIEMAGAVDISFNAVGVDVVQGIPLIDLPMNDFVTPVTATLQTRFLTAVAAAQIMKQQGSGVILSLTATPGGIAYPFTGGFAAACNAVESFTANLASEMGIYGVRAVNIRSGGSPDSRVFKEAIDNNPDVMAGVLQKMQNDTMLKKLPLMVDVANLAVFLASDFAGKITGVTVDVTGGTTVGLNYRAE
ncbi:SDR family NAD(P)-dependent oxidoreductase [Mucilaginibacter flavus]|uniref:SDR family NAD(P)-dependent oxidoreductase n=1 Tax=Mucilaginibacter flavus TaxID=931504 RepID=UPI0025B2F121|nr:SDR family oxidoreductase [Mucilaginibacter flavus]MDN3582810.1 SDR family oxidoreductase [Mucilaginibacter flavus]